MQKQKVVEESLAKAKHYSASKNYGRAFAHYLVCFELDENLKSQNVSDFADILCVWGNILVGQERFADLYKCYQQALHYLPHDVNILNNFGSHLLRNRYDEYAEKYFEAANTIDPSFLPAEKNLLTCKLNLVPRWHFRMLNDFTRNEAYRRAILKATNLQPNRILDIGAGSGILSLFASSCNADSITAVESSKTLAKIAGDVLVAHNIRNINVINSNSTTLSSCDIGLSNLLITEIFDTALFGEHVLKTLIHAWDNLLEPSAKIIPHFADVFVTGIYSRDVLIKHRLCNNFADLKLENVCVTQTGTEPYEAETLSDLEYDFITTSEKALTVNFSDVSALKSIYTNRDSIPPVKLKCIKAGTIVATTVWFDLFLDENISITTNPLKNSVKCWEQAIVYLDHPLTVRAGDEVQLKFTCVADKVQINIIEPLSSCCKCWKVSQDIITFLNDSSIVEPILKFAQHFTVEPFFDVLDLSPVPLFGLLLAKKGARVHCTAQNQADHEFLNYLKENNNLKLTIIPATAEDQFLQNAYDVVFINPLSKHGLLCEKTFNNIEMLTKALKPNGVLLPQRMKLVLEVVESHHLDYCCKVNDNNTFGFKISDFMNKYAVTEEWDVHPDQFSHKILSKRVRTKDIISITNEPELFEVEADIMEGGTANGILYWYELCYSDNIWISTYNSKHFGCACFIVDPPRCVSQYDRLGLTVKLHGGLLKIWCT